MDLLQLLYRSTFEEKYICESLEVGQGPVSTFIGSSRTSRTPPICVVSTRFHISNYPPSLQVFIHEVYLTLAIFF